MVNAYSFPGSLAMTSATLTSGASLTDSSFVVQDGSVNFYTNEVDRTGSVTTVSITYYIQINTNINSLIHHHAGATIEGISGDTVDDVWSFDGATYTQSSGADVSYNLPTITTNTRVELKDYYAYNRNDNSSGVGTEWRYTGETSWRTATGASGELLGRIFDLDIVFNSDNNGLIDAATTFFDASGTGFEIRVPENIAYTQVMSLDFSTSYTKTNTTTTDSTDILTYSISASTLNALGSGHEIKTKRDAVDSLYDGQNIFSAWTVTFDAQDASGRYDQSYNTITNYARNADWTTSSYGFNQDERLVTNQGYSFNLTILDKDSNSVSLIPSTTIYGILRQST